MRLRDMNAIITGAGVGIGRATALRFAEEGAKVMVAELDEATGRETAEEIRRAGGEAWFHQTDVADNAAVERMVEAAVAGFGSVNILVNNAAAFVFGRVEEVSAEGRLGEGPGGEHPRPHPHGAGPRADSSPSRASFPTTRPRVA